MIVACIHFGRDITFMVLDLFRLVRIYEQWGMWMGIARADTVWAAACDLNKRLVIYLMNSKKLKLCSHLT